MMSTIFLYLISIYALLAHGKKNTKLNLFFFQLILADTIILANALQCKFCDEADSDCLFGSTEKIRECDSDQDLCYSWFCRAGIHFSVF